MQKQYMFVSYDRQDSGMVLPIIEALKKEYKLRALDVKVWVDVFNLRPGQQWQGEIERALQDSVGMLVFVSPASMKSDWVRQELMAAMAHQDRLIIPIILRHTPDLPAVLQTRQWIDLSEEPTKSDIRRTAKLIADATEAHLGTGDTPTPPVTTTAAPVIAANIAQEARGAQRADADTGEPPDSVFVVHGHDNTALSDMQTYLTSLGVKPIILTKLGGSAQSLLQKFFKNASTARFAIVILSADDMGASRVQYDADGVGEKSLQFRARQNVILELGFFYGLLGWENVFVLYKPPEKVFPNFERPSDIDGAVFDPMDSAGDWRESLAEKLAEAGFELKNAH